MPIRRRNAISGAALFSAAVVTSAGAGTAHSKMGPTAQSTLLNVRDFGAVGDGATDDTLPLQAAINAASAAGGGRVRIPVGEYLLTNRITLADGIELVGEGSNSVLKPIFSNSPVINRVIDNDWVNGNRNITLRGFKLDRSGANIQHGILLNGVDNLLVDSIEISGYPSTTSGCLSVSAIGPSTRLISSNIRIVNSIFADTSNFGVQVGYVAGCIMANNSAYNAGREVFGVEPEPTTSATNVAITGNIVSGTTPVDGSETGLIISTVSSGGSVSGVTISGNVLRQQTPSTTSNPGILVLGGESVAVTGNSVIGTDGPGISIGNNAHPTNGVVVSGNNISDCGRFGRLPGILLRNAANSTITSNSVSGSALDSGVGYSILEESGSANNLVGLNSVQRPLGPLGRGSIESGNQVTSGNERAQTAGAPAAMRRRQIESDDSLLQSDQLVAVTDTTAPRYIRLPPANGTPAGTMFVVKDESGGAGSNAITISASEHDTIEGASVLIMDRNYAVVRLYCTGNGWAIA